MSKTSGGGTSLKPKALWKSRTEYQDFELRTFEFHYHNTKMRLIAAPYWQHRRNITAMREQKKQAELLKRDWDEYVLCEQMKGSISALPAQEIEEMGKGNYSGMKVEELKELLRSRKLKLGGKKDELIKRLTLADAESQNQVDG